MYKITTHSPEETIEFANKVGSLLKGGDVIAYIGGLGAGKTTFTRGIAVGMGLPDEVISPTFSLVNEYSGATNLYHFDMYRINSSDDLETTGFYDYLTDNNVLAIEWSENIIDALPKNTIFIKLINLNENTRQIEIDGGERFASIGD